MGWGGGEALDQKKIGTILKLENGGGTSESNLHVTHLHLKVIYR